jgi:hypothetical protein
MGANLGKLIVPFGVMPGLIPGIHAEERCAVADFHVDPGV